MVEGNRARGVLAMRGSTVEESSSTSKNRPSHHKYKSPKQSKKRPTGLM